MKTTQVAGDAQDGSQLHGQLTRVTDLIPASLPTTRRFVVAIAGPPASGKTTLARELCARLGDNAAVFGLDAYHYDNAILEQRGLLDRKGSISTFDPDAYRRDLITLRHSPEQAISIPVFDRKLELSRNCAKIVTSSQQIVITEGNYLLIEDTPWSQLSDLFDLTIWIDASVETLRSRLSDRWLEHGYDDAEVTRRVEHNDLPNATFVQARSGPAQLRL